MQADPTAISGKADTAGRDERRRRPVAAPGYWRQHVHKESARNTGSPTARSGMTNQTPARERLGAHGVAERLGVPLKPGNAGGGKGPQFKKDAGRSEGPGDWATGPAGAAAKSGASGPAPAEAREGMAAPLPCVQGAQAAATPPGIALQAAGRTRLGASSGRQPKAHSLLDRARGGSGVAATPVHYGSRDACGVPYGSITGLGDATPTQSRTQNRQPAFLRPAGSARYQTGEGGPKATRLGGRQRSRGVST